MIQGLFGGRHRCTCKKATGSTSNSAKRSKPHRFHPYPGLKRRSASPTVVERNRSDEILSCKHFPKPGFRVEASVARMMPFKSHTHVQGCRTSNPDNSSPMTSGGAKLAWMPRTVPVCRMRSVIKWTWSLCHAVPDPSSTALLPLFLIAFTRPCAPKIAEITHARVFECDHIRSPQSPCQEDSSGPGASHPSTQHRRCLFFGSLKGGLLTGQDPATYNTADPLRLWIIQLGASTPGFALFFFRWYSSERRRRPHDGAAARFDSGKDQTASRHRRDPRRHSIG